MITASEPSWIAPFTGLSPRQFGKLVTVLRREGADAVRKGRSWSLPLEDRAPLVAAYWRTNLTMRQLAPLFGVWPRLGPDVHGLADLPQTTKAVPDVLLGPRVTSDGVTCATF